MIHVHIINKLNIESKAYCIYTIIVGMVQNCHKKLTVIGTKIEKSRAPGYTYSQVNIINKHAKCKIHFIEYKNRDIVIKNKNILILHLPHLTQYQIVQVYILKAHGHGYYKIINLHY